jgi:hypothetical protein
MNHLFKESKFYILLTTCICVYPEVPTIKIIFSIKNIKRLLFKAEQHNVSYEVRNEFLYIQINSVFEGLNYGDK